MDQLKPAKYHVQLPLSCLYMAVLSNIDVNTPLKILELLELILKGATCKARSVQLFTTKMPIVKVFLKSHSYHMKERDT